MYGSVKIPGMHAIFFLMELPEEREGLDVEEGAWVEIPSNIGLWSEGADDPRQTLCRSTSDPLHYKLFRGDRGINPAEFEPTGMSFGGTLSSSAWRRFAEGVPAIKAFHAIPDTEPPGAMDEILRSIRGAR
jgi:hypothetical protein